jgi:hypothetical protein
VFPEPFEGNVGVVVGVLPLPLVDGHFWIGERTEGVLGGLFPWNTIIFLFLCIVLLLGRRLLGFLGGFFLGSGLFFGSSFLLGCYNELAGREMFGVRVYWMRWEMNLGSPETSK